MGIYLNTSPGFMRRSEWPLNTHYLSQQISQTYEAEKTLGLASSAGAEFLVNP